MVDIIDIFNALKKDSETFPGTTRTIAEAFFDKPDNWLNDELWTWALVRKLEPILSDQDRLKSIMASLNKVLIALAEDVGNPNKISNDIRAVLREFLGAVPDSQIDEKVADGIKAIAGSLLLPASDRPIDAAKIAKISGDFGKEVISWLLLGAPSGQINREKLEKLGRTFLEKCKPLLAELKIPTPATPNLPDQFADLRSPSAQAALDLFKLPVWLDNKMSELTLTELAAPLSWTGAIPGVEFGYFDIAETGVRNVRLSPLPLPEIPPPLLPLLGFCVFGIPGMLLGASAEYGPVLTAAILYSAFPGYPGFFDVPVEDGLPFTHLPYGWDESVVASNRSNPLLWPTSGVFPVGPNNVKHLVIAANLRTILEEELGGPLSPQFSGLSVLTPLASSLPEIARKWEKTQFNPEELQRLAPPTLRVVRPASLAFYERLLNPPPVVILDPHRSRAFLLLPYKGNWQAQPLYHAQASKFLRTANAQGVKSLYDRAAADGDLHDRENESCKHKNGFEDSFLAPSEQVTSLNCVEHIQYDGASGLYNWELFYHLPLRFAQQLAVDLKFTQANAWLRQVFDPTMSQGPVPARFWRFKALYDEAKVGLPEAIDQILENSGAIGQWRANPTDADAIAQTRSGAYQRATVMQTIDTLVSWGDKLFRENKSESINEAALHYLTASGILGKRPPEANVPRPKSHTYNSLRQGDAPLNSFGGARVSIENLMTSNGAGTNTGVGSNGTVASSLGAMSGLSMFYFGVPGNEKLRSYWDIIDDRLFKIRHSLDIKGHPRTDILNTERWGTKVTESITGVHSPWGMPDAQAIDAVPIYRFTFALQKANEFCAEVKALGGALLSAYEKRDSEALARLRSDQEMRILGATEQVRRMQIEEASAAVAAAEQTQHGAEIRKTYYEARCGEFMNAAESIKETLSIASSVFQVGSGIAELAAAGVNALPDFSIDIGGDVGFPKATGNAKYSYRYGASHIAAAISAGGRALSLTSSVLGILSSLAGTQAMYQRRMEEWRHQRDLAENDEELFKKQKESAELRLQIAQKELENHRVQIANAQEVADFMREKFTNEELYQWMVEELSRTYMATYELAFGLAKNAQISYKYEHPEDTTDYIAAPNWDSLRAGLLAGEGLQFQLRQMEIAWLAKNTREAELVKHISLHQHDPETLIRLRQTGCCYLNLPEWLFDEDHPGQYMRRIKSVSLTIPCVAGPYTSVNCRLTLESSRIRIDPIPPSRPEDYPEKPADTRFKAISCSTAAIVTSSGQNDSGLFELNLRDERFLPFEGAGAISQWRIELPKDTNRFDLATISDVVLHLKYTAIDAEGVELRRNAFLATFGHSPSVTTEFHSDLDSKTRIQSFSAKAEFSDGWYRFVKADSGTNPHVLELDLGTPRFPYVSPGSKFELLSIEAILLGPERTGNDWKATWSLRETGGNYVEIQRDVAFEQSDSVGGLYRSKISFSDDRPAPHDPFCRWHMALNGAPSNASLELADVLVLCEYHVVVSGNS